MVLILNTVTNAEYSQLFYSRIRDKIYPQMQVRNLRIGDSIGDLKECSHLIISGSGLSTVTGSIEEEQFMEVVDHFVSRDKAILGICYGHQLLAKYLGGQGKVGKSVNPQFGFRKIKLKENDLFRSMSDTYSMVAHFDEVRDLGKDIEIIATDNEGMIQGFQYRNHRVWGVQFHPEYDYFAGMASWQRKIRNHPEWLKYYRNEVPSYNSTKGNGMVFSNFINL